MSSRWYYREKIVVSIVGGGIPGREPSEPAGVLEMLLYLDLGGSYKGLHNIKMHPVHLRFVHITRPIVYLKQGPPEDKRTKDRTDPGTTDILVLYDISRGPAWWWSFPGPEVLFWFFSLLFQSVLGFRSQQAMTRCLLRAAHSSPRVSIHCSFPTHLPCARPCAESWDYEDKFKAAKSAQTKRWVLQEKGGVPAAANSSISTGTIIIVTNNHRLWTARCFMCVTDFFPS